MREFTVEELAAFDGKDGRAAYAAYKGTVYDISASAMWVEGDHEGWHAAGADLTAEHADAPHDEYVVDFPAVGKLI